MRSYKAASKIKCKKRFNFSLFRVLLNLVATLVLSIWAASRGGRLFSGKMDIFMKSLANWNGKWLNKAGQPTP